MSDIVSKTITRRTALKAAVGTAGVAAMGSLVYQNWDFKKAFAADDTAPPAAEVAYSWCKNCTSPQCGIEVELENGVAVRLRGNTEWPASRGALCCRGSSALASIYNPYRVKAPLKRTNPEKGMDQDPGWVEISWEEAFDTIAQELKRVHAEDPRKFVHVNGFSRSGSIMEGLDFCMAFGSPNYVEVDGPTCSVHFGPAELMGNFGGPSPDIGRCNYMINFGAGSQAQCGYANGIKGFVDAVQRGMKVVSVNPRASVEASKGEWVPIMPGTDLAFVLAMHNVIVHEMDAYQKNQEDEAQRAEESGGGAREFLFRGSMAQPRKEVPPAIQKIRQDFVKPQE